MPSYTDLTSDERKRRGINRAGDPRQTADPFARKHGKPYRQHDASIRAEEATVRSCGYPHTDNGWTFVGRRSHYHSLMLVLADSSAPR